MAVLSGVSLRASAALRADQELWPALLKSLQGRVHWEPLNEESLVPPPPAWPAAAHSRARGNAATSPRWAYLESDFSYTAHRTVCSKSQAGFEDLGTQYPAVLLFEASNSATDAAELASLFAEWMAAPASPFSRSRLLLLLSGKRPATLGAVPAAALSTALLRWGVGFVEVRSAEHAAEYAAQCASAIVIAKKRRVPSRFKVAGVRCLTLPKDHDRLLVTWVSQLMQIPGVSEEIAKAVAGKHPSPSALLEAVAAASAAQADQAAAADSFLSNMEYPIRGKKGTRRLGPVVSRRIFSLFHPAATPEHVLV